MGMSAEEMREYGEEPVSINTDFSNVIIVDTLPVVGMDRYSKLLSVVKKIFSAFGAISTDGIFMPFDEESKKTVGKCFIEYESSEFAQRAKAQGDGKKLDAKHKLNVNLWHEYDKYMKVPPTYKEPDKQEYESKVHLTSFQLDPQLRDQFVLRAGRETQIFWNDPYRCAEKQGRKLQYSGERETSRGKTWTESYVGWSTRGLYLATFHNQGIVLWGGDDFEKLGRFMHPRVNTIQFSPSEKYLVTSNGTDRESKADPYCIQVWDIRSQKLLRGFDRKDAKGGWPFFKWSGDDKYFGRANEDAISIYETPEMNLLEKKSIKIPRVSIMEWSPTDNVIAYYVPEKDHQPATVALLEIPSREIIREKHVVNVAENEPVDMFWQSHGDYLCVKVARKKTKKTIINNFEIFRMKGQGIPVETLEIDDVFITFAWEPKGHRFCIVHGNPAAPDVTFYQIKAKKIVELKKFEKRVANYIKWSPQGDYVVVAGLGDKNGRLEFINLKDMTTCVETEHMLCTDVEWDNSGRFVITSVTQPIDGSGSFRFTMENGYKLWSAAGQLLANVSVDQCYQVLWRPRPDPLLSKEQIREIKANIKEKYYKQFEMEDDEIKQSQLSGAAKERQNWKQQWLEFRSKAKEIYQAEAEERAALRDGMESDDEQDLVQTEQIIEEELSREVVVL